MNEMISRPTILSVNQNCSLLPSDQVINEQADVV